MYTLDDERGQVHPSWHLPPYHVPPSTDACDILNTPPPSPYTTYASPHFCTPPPSPAPPRFAHHYDTPTSKVAAAPPPPPYEQHQLQQGDISTVSLSSPYGPPAPTARAEVVAFDANGKQIGVTTPQRPVQQLSYVQEVKERTSGQCSPQNMDSPAARGHSLERSMTSLESESRDAGIGPRVKRLASAASDRTQIYFPQGDTCASESDIITRGVASFIDKSSSRPTLAPTVPVLCDVPLRAPAAKGTDDVAEGPERQTPEHDEDDVLYLMSSLIVRGASLFKMWCYSVGCVMEDVSKDMLELCKANHTSVAANRDSDLQSSIFQPLASIIHSQDDVSIVGYEAISDHTASHVTVHPFDETNHSRSWKNAAVKIEPQISQNRVKRSTPPLTQSFEYDIHSGTATNSDSMEFTPYGPAPRQHVSGHTGGMLAPAGGPPHIEATRDVAFSGGELDHSFLRQAGRPMRNRDLCSEGSDSVGFLRSELLGTDSDEEWCTANDAREDGTRVKRKKGSKVNWREKTASFNSTEGDLMFPRGRAEKLWRRITERKSYVAKLPQSPSDWSPTAPSTNQVARKPLSSDPSIDDNSNQQTMTFQYRRPHTEWKNKHMSSSEGSTYIPPHNAASSVESYRPYGEAGHLPAHYMGKQDARHHAYGNDRHTDDWSIIAGPQEYQQDDYNEEN
eukprot:GEMP01010721.1.p1 GENE.GEMP01010721.1~~GEMP01010721.1.p1  ORF type:complete len:678 (+),score=168.09 GEMP01010721.1:84-2117(+)